MTAPHIFHGQPGFILNSDSVVFFQQSDPDYIEGQKLLASTILSPEFQSVFNISKGSIPARLDVDLSKGFNACQQTSQADLAASIKAGTLVRSMAHNMTVLQKYRGAMMEVITEFVKSGGQDTLPTYMLGQMRRALTPEVNAISSVLLALTVLLLTAFFLLTRKND